MHGMHKHQPQLLNVPPHLCPSHLSESRLGKPNGLQRHIVHSRRPIVEFLKVRNFHLLDKISDRRLDLTVFQDIKVQNRQRPSKMGCCPFVRRPELILAWSLGSTEDLPRDSINMIASYILSQTHGRESHRAKVL